MPSSRPSLLCYAAEGTGRRTVEAAGRIEERHNRAEGPGRESVRSEKYVRQGTCNVFHFVPVTVAYLRRENPIVHQWILEPALSQGSAMTIQLKKGSDHLLFRGLTGASGSTAILTNWGETQTATVALQGRAQGEERGDRAGSAGDHRGRQHAGLATRGGGSRCGADDRVTNLAFTLTGRHGELKSPWRLVVPGSVRILAVQSGIRGEVPHTKGSER